ncbi:MAG: hypothetical protein SangKO_077520 [Sandaracinaceae bacterium]
MTLLRLVTRILTFLLWIVGCNAESHVVHSQSWGASSGGEESTSAKGIQEDEDCLGTIPDDLRGQYAAEAGPGQHACLLLYGNRVSFVSMAADSERGCSSDSRLTCLKAHGLLAVDSADGRQIELQVRRDSLRFSHARSPMCAHLPAHRFVFSRASRTEGTSCFE